MAKTTLPQIREAITSNFINSFRLIYFAIIFGVSIFFIIIIYLYFNGSETKETIQQNISTMNIMTLIHFIILFASLVISNNILKFTLSRKQIESTVQKINKRDDSDIANNYISVIRSAKTVQIAVLEAPAFFGLVTCFIAISSSVIYQYQYYWINIISYFFFIYKLYNDIPTKEKITALIDDKLNYLSEY